MTRESCLRGEKGARLYLELEGTELTLLIEGTRGTEGTERTLHPELGIKIERKKKE